MNKLYFFLIPIGILQIALIAGCAKNNKIDNLYIPIDRNSAVFSFEDHKTTTAQVILKLGQPDQKIEFEKRENFEFIIDSKKFCIYFDEAGIVAATENTGCSHREHYIPKYSLTPSHPPHFLTNDH